MINGFVKVKAMDFDTLNNEWTVKANELYNMNCEPYTDCRPDTNPEYVWAKIEHDKLTDLPIVSEEEAILQGMVDFSQIV